MEEKQQSLSRKLQIGHFDAVRYQASRGEIDVPWIDRSMAQFHGSRHDRLS